MLSRIGENVYWLGRYVERVDDTVRLVATHYYGLLQIGTSDDGLLPDDLLAVLGNPPAGGDTSLRAAVARCVTDADNQSSVASCLRAARENARRSREVLPLELWETLSAATRWLDGPGRHAEPDELLREMPQWTRAFCGLVDMAMPRTTAWTTLRLGTLLERTDMTLRVLILAADTIAKRPAGDPLTAHLWTTVLKACGALENFWATSAGFPTGDAVAQALLRDPACPRSVRFCLRAVSALLEGGEPARRTEELAAEVEAGADERLLADGSDRLRALLDRCGGVHTAITETYLDLREAS